MMNSRKRKKEPITKTPPEGTYSIWKQYNEFIRRLYLEKPIKKLTGKQLTLKFLSKLAIVFIGAFFTTLTFYFLIDPNGIYNSGLNGLLQTFSKLIVGHSNLGWGSYYLLYYGLGLLINLLFIFILRIFFKAKLEIISTSIFYVLSQIIWTQIFKVTNLKDYVFNRFNPSSWQGLSTHSQLSFTLPYYIVIAMVAAIIHTYGYSQIFQAQATPGGLEIFTSHFSAQKERKISISTFMKIFGVIIIFAVTLVNFKWVEDSTAMKKSTLQKEILEKENEREASSEAKQIIRKLKQGGFEVVLDDWKKDMERIKNLQEKGDMEECFKIKEKNQWLTSLFENKVGESQLENYPQEVKYYLASEKEKLSELEGEIEEISLKLRRDNIEGKVLERNLQRRSNLEERTKKLKKELERNSLMKYLGYISNNERLWATMVYIFLSSFLIGQIFPRDQTVLLRLHSSTEENHHKGLKLLENFSPVYYTVYRRKGENQEVIFVTNCYLSKWNYYLLSPYLKQVGKTYVHESTK